MKRAGTLIVALVATPLGCGAPPGTLRIFTPGGLLLMDSCGETYRIAQWGAIDDSRIEWTEDSARIEDRS